MSEKKEFSHIDAGGNPGMVDVSEKQPTLRTATARGKVHLPAEVMKELQEQGFATKKGPVFQTAVLAGTMAAKKTGELIPLCHPLGLDDIKIRIETEGEAVVITATARIFAKTGVEMEALTAVSVAALTIYDMCKAMSQDIVIGEIQLMEKTGGKHEYRREK